ncbi:MAG TPA: TetR/AcrR family transcriptional regulator [Deltaproteobacteria bacterium]|nr:TetR/AcrR family transcriptional regulator [Deltaproteobacteria bacterium]HOI06919.1 TetR/AcrR family transcriptional regulator [Deltaproteobacteria bacterium]
MPDKVRKNAHLRKPEILKAFYETIVEEGIEGASIGKVARRMGIHPSLIMHYFSTKENMTLELVDSVISEYAGLLSNIRVDRGDARARLLLLNDLLWSEEWYGMTKIAADFAMISLSFRNREIDEKVRHLYALFRKFLSRELTSYVEAGIVREQDPVTAAQVVITLLEGYRHFKHLYVDENASERFREEMKATLLRLLGYRDEPGARPVRDQNTHDTEVA